jgi:hypothetical protein
MANMVFRLSSG